MLTAGARRQRQEAGGREQILYAEEEAGGRGRMQMQDAEAEEAKGRSTRGGFPAK